MPTPAAAGLNYNQPKQRRPRRSGLGGMPSMDTLLNTPVSTAPRPSPKSPATGGASPLGIAPANANTRQTIADLHMMPASRVTPQMVQMFRGGADEGALIPPSSQPSPPQFRGRPAPSLTMTPGPGMEQSPTGPTQSDFDRARQNLEQFQRLQQQAPSIAASMGVPTARDAMQVSTGSPGDYQAQLNGDHFYGGADRGAGNTRLPPMMGEEASRFSLGSTGSTALKTAVRGLGSPNLTPEEQESFQARRQAYEARREAELAQRRQGVVENAQQDAAARQQRMQARGMPPSPLQQMLASGRMQPRDLAALMAVQQRGQLGMAELMQQQQQAAAEQQMQQQQLGLDRELGQGNLEIRRGEQEFNQRWGPFAMAAGADPQMLQMFPNLTAAISGSLPGGNAQGGALPIPLVTAAPEQQKAMIERTVDAVQAKRMTPEAARAQLAQMGITDEQLASAIDEPSWDFSWEISQWPSPSQDAVEERRREIERFNALREMRGLPPIDRRTNPRLSLF